MCHGAVVCLEGEQMINDVNTKYVIYYARKRSRLSVSLGSPSAGSINFTFKKEKSYVQTLLVIIPWMVQHNKYFSSNYTAQYTKEEL